MSKARSTRVSWCFVGPRRAIAGWRCGGLWASRVAEWWHRFLLRRAAGLLLALWVAACARPPAGASGGVVSEEIGRAHV